MLLPRYSHQVVQTHVQHTPKRAAANGAFPDDRSSTGTGSAKFMLIIGDIRRRILPLYAATTGQPPKPEGPDGRPAIKPIEQLVLVSSMRYRTSTPSLSTWWSSTALKPDLVSRWASRLDAFSGYPFRT